MRRLMYLMFYIYDAGISKTPWNDPRFFISAAGDDGLIYCIGEDLAKNIK